MKCSSVKSLIDSYLDGTCDAKKARSIEEHIASCKECAEEFEYAKRVRERMKALPLMKTPAGFEDRIFRLTGTSVSSSGSKIVRFLNRKTVLIPLGSVAAIIMGLSIFLITDFRTEKKSADQILGSKAETSGYTRVDKKVSSKKKDTGTVAAVAPEKNVPSSKPSETKRSVERQSAGKYIETEIHLAYNDSPIVAKADTVSPSAEKSVLEESQRDSDSVELKKESSPALSAKRESYKSSAPANVISHDDFADKIDRVILSSGGTRVRLNGKSSVKASTGGNNASAQDTYTAKVIVPEDAYDGLIRRLSALGTLSSPAVRPVAEKGYMVFILTVRRGN